MHAAKSSKLYYNYMLILVIHYRIHHDINMTPAELQILINRIEQQRETIKTIRFKLLIISLRNNSCVRLSNNHIGDAGAEYLARALPNMSQLSYLELVDDIIMTVLLLLC